MKKLIVLFSLIALLASGMAFAQVTFTGKIEVEAANDFDNEEGSASLEKWDPDVRVELNIKADENSSGYIRTRIRKDQKVVTQSGTPDKTTNLWYVDYDRAFFTNNVLGSLGVKDVPVKWISQFGMNDWAPAQVALAGYDTTNKVLFRDKNKNTYFFDEAIWATKQSFTFADMVNVGVMMGISNDRLQDFYVDGSAKLPVGPGTLGLQISYNLWENKTIWFDLAEPRLEIGDGVMMIGAGYDFKAGDIPLKVGGAYYLPMDDKISYQVYAFNAKATIGPAYVVAGFQGVPENEDLFIEAQAIHNVRLAAGMKFTPIIGADVGVVLYTGGEEVNQVGDDRETLNTLDASVWLKAGKVTYRVGYLYVPDDDVSIQPYKTDSIQRSFYMLATLAF
jgi:hypothetical protein